MLIKNYLEKLLEYKKYIIGLFLVGCILFSVVGYFDRNAVNEDIVYCSESNLLVNVNMKDIKAVIQDNESGKKYRKIILSDNVINETITALDNKGISMTSQMLKESAVITEEDNVVTIVVYGSTGDLAQEICQEMMQKAQAELGKYVDGSVVVLNGASDPYSATVELAGTSVLLTPKDAVVISGTYIAKTMIKYAFLGGMLFVLVGVFVLTIKILYKKDDEAC